MFSRIGYLDYAKSTFGRHPLELSMSSIPHLTWEEAGLPLGPFPLVGDNLRGMPELKERIASRYDVAPDRVVIAAGCSMANFLACGAVVEAGDTVLVEEPTYEPLWRAPSALGCKIVRFSRRRTAGYQVDPDEVADLLRMHRARLVVVSDLHNPTGISLARKDALIRVVESGGAYLLSDEVYLDFLGEESGGPAAACSDRVLSTNSLTKVYGLGFLRIGWALMDPALAWKAHAVYDHLNVVDPYITGVLALEVWERLDSILDGALSLSRENLAILRRWIDGRRDVEWVDPGHGLIALLHLEGVSDTRAFCARLLEERSTVVVPGEHFGVPGALRVGLGAPADVLHQALDNLGKALDEARG